MDEGIRWTRHLIAVCVVTYLSAALQTPAYTIDAIRYATIRDFPKAGLVIGVVGRQSSARDASSGT